MRIALTGSTGLIGGGIFQSLRSEHEILRLGRRQECDVRLDLADVHSMAGLDLKGYDVLIHCAGIVDGDFVTSPQRAWNQAVAGAEELAKRALAGGVGRVICFSAAHVYGPLQGIISEDNVPNPLTQYAMAHYVTEQVFKSYAPKGLKVILVRPNAVYGLPASWEGFDRWEIVPYDFPLQAVYQRKIVLKSKGEQKRNFIALDDLIGYVKRLLTVSFDEVFVLNAVGSESLRIIDFAQICAEVYYHQTGQVCSIEKAIGTFGQEKDYQPVTKHNDFKPSRHVKDFLEKFIKQVIERAEKGVFYGQHSQ